MLFIVTRGEKWSPSEKTEEKWRARGGQFKRPGSWATGHNLNWDSPTALIVLVFVSISQLRNGDKACNNEIVSAGLNSLQICHKAGYICVQKEDFFKLWSVLFCYCHCFQQMASSLFVARLHFCFDEIDIFETKEKAKMDLAAILFTIETDYRHYVHM